MLEQNNYTEAKFSLILFGKNIGFPCYCSSNPPTPPPKKKEIFIRHDYSLYLTFSKVIHIRILRLSSLAFNVFNPISSDQFCFPSKAVIKMALSLGLPYVNTFLNENIFLHLGQFLSSPITFMYSTFDLVHMQSAYNWREQGVWPTPLTLKNVVA